MQALEGLRILDLTGGVAGPLGILQLAEHGADVVKVEPPGGRADRAAPASRVYNRSRRSITLNLAHPVGRSIFRELCSTADVVAESFAPGTMARFGLHYEALAEEFPRLIYCSVPAWPAGSRFESGPGYEALLHARTGQQWENTAFRSGPMFLRSPVASLGAMFLVPIGIMAALLSRERSGRGQRVEVSLLQGVLSLTTQNWNWTDRGQFSLPKSHPPGIHQASIYECAGGEWIHAATTSGVDPRRSEASILGLDEIPPLQLLSMEAGERALYEQRRREAYRRQDRASLVEAFHEAGLGAEAIVAPHEKFTHPQLRATGSVVEVVDPEVGPTTQLGPTLFLGATPGAVKGAQPPAGAHNEEVFGSLGHTPSEVAAWRDDGIV
jgi:crotonobetainyl-CoA:carnitine CoA-transferase CaiB-like acyl-CoA transferase